MTEGAKKWYADKIKYFGDQEKTRLLIIDATTNNILFVHVPKMQGDKPSPAFLAALGHAGTTYWSARDVVSRDVTSAIDGFEKAAVGWFGEKDGKRDFKAAMETLRAGFQKLVDSDRAVVGAFDALMHEDLGAGQNLAARANESAKEGKKDIDAALDTLGGRLLGALSCNAEAPEDPPGAKDPLEPLTPGLPEEHRAAFAEWLAYLRLMKEKRLGIVTAFRKDIASRITGYPGVLAQPCPPETPTTLIKVTAAARRSFSNSSLDLERNTVNDIDTFTADGLGWLAGDSVRQDFANQMTSLRKAFGQFRDAGEKLAEAYTNLESEIAPEKTNFPKAAELAAQAEATANDCAACVEKELSALGKLF